eukprot:gene12400-16632_t
MKVFNAKYQTLEKGVELLNKSSSDIEDPAEKISPASSPTSSTNSFNGKNTSSIGTTEKAQENKKKKLSLYELFRVLSPYFWPAAGTDGAIINRIRSCSTWFAVIASKLCNLYAPSYLSNATNFLLIGNFSNAAFSMIIFCTLKFFSSVFKELQSVLYIKVKQQASIQLQELTFTHLHTLSLNWHLSKKTGSVMKSMDRGTDAANQLISYLFLFLGPALLECFAVIALFFIQYKQWLLGLTVLIGVTLYCVATVIITQYRKKFREETNKHDNDFHDKATDSIINYETVKYFTGEAFEIDRFKQSVIKYQKFNSSTQLSLSFLNSTQQLILNATLLMTMCIAGYAVSKHKMTIGGWVAVQSWVTTIFVPLGFLGSVYSAIFQAFIDIRNLSELLSESPDIVDKPNALDLPLVHQNASIELGAVSSPFDVTGVSVEFNQIRFNYPEQPVTRGLKNVSFYVRPGTTTAIVGHTGAGKTTISRLLFRFYDPREGSVLINGYDIKNFTQKSVRNAVGIVPQDTVLFNDTILHNIRYGRLSASFQEVVQAAEAAQIRSFIESLPEKWETVVGERGLKLSGGEKQRVAIARCLLKNPPVVLLDEATSALDTITENSIQEALHALGHNRTVLIIAHRLSTIKHANQIIVLDGGRVVEIGTHDQLLNNNNSHYKRMWEMQTTSLGIIRNNPSTEDFSIHSTGEDTKFNDQYS